MIISLFKILNYSMLGLITLIFFLVLPNTTANHFVSIEGFVYTVIIVVVSFIIGYVSATIDFYQKYNKSYKRGLDE